ncbi:MAG: excinuclease subunit excinuclease subunit [Candidatus Berkelbacteria bacterium]|nr:excinuclease subunit excinuclease subunit [Candidatus Berkelbacteria bacterium]
MSSRNKIIIHGAREHNLKNINLEIPRDKIVVITGISGSGKSTLAFDTIYAEGQRRYVESLSTYARQFFGNLEKPDVDWIENLSPAISIDQRSASQNPRSTVGTVTEIYDYLRVLFARVGRPHCPNCKRVLTKQTPEEISQNIIKEFQTSKNIVFLSPQVKNQKGEHKYLLANLKALKISKVRIDGILMDILEAQIVDLDRSKLHTIDALIEVRTNLENINEVLKTVEKSLKMGQGNLSVIDLDSNKEVKYSQKFTCPKCKTVLDELHPRMFSFNSPQGACPTCQGLGRRYEIDPTLVLPNPRLTLAEGAIRPWSRITSHASWYNKTLNELSTRNKFSLDDPVGELPKKIRQIVLYGDGVFEGVIPNLERRYKETDSDYLKQEIEKYMVERICPACKGKRLRPEVLSITVDNRNIVDITSSSIEKLFTYFKGLSDSKNLTPNEKIIAEEIVKSVIERLGFLQDVGLGYLTLNRNAQTLAGGEAQRIRLATQLGTGLMGVIYVLDEPSIGLHARDHEKLLKTFDTLKDLGNTVIVVEHDKATIENADWIIDIGPGAGDHGGEVVAEGTVEKVKTNDKSLTGLYLSGKRKIDIPKKRRSQSNQQLVIRGASEYNLKNIDVNIPLNNFVCITGVSGSGKSTLILEILAKALAGKIHHAKEEAGKYKAISGIKFLDKVISVDQSPIGRTPRSNPATYTNLFTPIREVFASTPEAMANNLDASKFSFNLRGGRCETCRGDGVLKIEMHFLPDVYVTCPECKGKRYNQEILDITFKDKTIADILDMTVEEAREFFKDYGEIYDKLSVLESVGLGYMHLGQPATTLSGGEAQRIKLATELARHDTGKTLYILDEPTTGLHFEDIKRLLSVLQTLVDRGNTVIVIEHNLDVIKSADWIIDLGPEGGDGGGQIVAQGSPEQIIKVSNSYTGKYLKAELK